MEISMSNPSSFYFFLFYLLAFFFVFVIVIVFSLKRGYHLRSVLLMLTTLTLLTIIGSRLFTIPMNEWVHILGKDSIVEYNNRSAIGGLLFGLIGLLFSQKLFGFNRPIIDLYAWLVPISLGIQKIGCFFIGCCYGKPSDLFWSVKYPKGAHAHFNQWTAGIIDENSLFSLNVHPVQLYETLFLFTIGFVVWRTHHIWKSKVSALFFGLFLFFTFRFFIEFLRDPASSQFSEQYLFGVRLFQWFLLSLGLLFGFIFLYFEKYLKTDVLKSSQNSPYIRVDVLYIFAISVVVYAFHGLFSRFELVAIWMQFLPAILLTLYYLYVVNTSKRYRTVTGFLILVPLYVISQSVQGDSTKVEKYKRIDVGTSIGSFYNEVYFNPQQGECGTSYASEFYKHVYRVGGVGFSEIIKKNNSITTYGINLHAGNNKTTSLTSNEEKSSFMYAVNPFIKFDGNWIGGGFGFQAGNLKRNSNETIEAENASDAQKNYHFFPEFYFRVGRRDIVDVDYNYGFLFPSPYPSLYQRISIGTGLGHKSDYSLRYGVFLPIESRFLSAEGLINKNIGVNMMYIFKESAIYQNENQKGKFVLGLNYRFGHKNK